jgi:hypothetical protein
VCGLLRSRLHEVYRRDGTELGSTVGFGEDRLYQVDFDIPPYDIECSAEFNIADVVSTRIGVDQPRNAVGRLRLPVIVDPLHEG